ncbi:hypothetical protein IAQ67_28330 (plasmid) [Paenibacillus peoriae]|uniref:Phage tail protein n=1 Tax=Paenibacillus peoriae TaxID=59893 RepID=A0A7H0YH68_9BACL|nr:hypothetical protein [Paenibacillus peoriae]QNR70426.1 hypothetical protein IAQ67_28330 [Paenibacillus peoriae]
MSHANNKNKKMLIKGAGKFMAKIPGCDELITLGTMNNMRLDIQLDMQDVEGGDSSVALDTILRKKTIDITAEDAKFDLNMFRLVLGSKLREGVNGSAYKMVGETVTLPSTAPFTVALSEKSVGTPAATAFLNNQAGQQLTITHDAGANTVEIVGGVTGGETVYISYAVATSADKDGYVWVIEEKHVVEGGQITLGFGTTLFAEDGNKTKHISIRGLKSNKLLKQVATGTPGEHEYKVDPTTGVVTFNTHMEKADIYVNYKRSEVVDVLDISTKDFPLTVSVVHDGLFNQTDESIQGFQTELYTCRVKSNFTLDAQRQQASTHSVTLTVIDSERADGKLGTIKRYEVPNTNTVDC